MNNEIKGYKLADGSNSTDYKIGDTFEVVSGSNSCFATKVGDIITLTRDDNSESPLFDEGMTDIIYKCCSYSDLIPTPETKSAVENRQENKFFEELWSEDTPEESVQTPRQILEQAFQEILDKHGVVIDEVAIDWTNTSTLSGIKHRVDNITIIGGCVK